MIEISRMLWWALPAPEWMMLWCYVDVHLYLHHFGTFRNQSYDLIWKSDVNDSPPIGHWHFTCCSPVWRLSQWCNKHCKPMGQRPLLKLERWDWLAGCLNESRARNNNCKVQEMESQWVETLPQSCNLNVYLLERSRSRSWKSFNTFFS